MILLASDICNALKVYVQYCRPKLVDDAVVEGKAVPPFYR